MQKRLKDLVRLYIANEFESAKKQGKEPWNRCEAVLEALSNPVSEVVAEVDDMFWSLSLQVHPCEYHAIYIPAIGSGDADGSHTCVSRDFLYEVSDYNQHQLEVDRVADILRGLLDKARNNAGKIMRYAVFKGLAEPFWEQHYTDPLAFTANDGDVDPSEFLTDYEKTEVDVTDAFEYIFKLSGYYNDLPIVFVWYVNPGQLNLWLQTGEFDKWYHYEVNGLSGSNLTKSDLFDGANLVLDLAESVCDDDKEAYQKFAATQPTIKEAVEMFGGHFWETDLPEYEENYLYP